jgi:hypothetical protein
MPNIHQTVKELKDLEAGGPGSGRHKEFGFKPAPRSGPLAVVGAPKDSKVFDHKSGDQLSMHKGGDWDIYDEEGIEKGSGNGVASMNNHLAKNYKAKK